MLVRDIIDIDSTYEDFETTEEESKQTIKKDNKKEEDQDLKNNNDQPLEEDEFSVSLAKMEEEIKPKIINILNILSKNYHKTSKISKRKIRVLTSIKRLVYIKKQKF